MKEDIEVLEKFLRVCDEDLYTEISIRCDGLTRKAIENLLKGYKELEIENQSYIDYFGNPPCYDDAKFIPITAIEEKIEELDKEYTKTLSKYGNIYTDIFFDVDDNDDKEKLNTITDQIMILKELLGERTK